jgi:hypothetical protein
LSFTIRILQKRFFEIWKKIETKRTSVDIPRKGELKGLVCILDSNFKCTLKVRIDEKFNPFENTQVFPRKRGSLFYCQNFNRFSHS